MMKKTTLTILFVCLFVSTGLASYTYEVHNYDINSKSLHNSESILFDQQGGMLTVNLFDESFADILGTSDLAEGSGGIWEIRTTGSSTGHLEMTGGEVHMIDLDGDFMLVLKGGLINEIYIDQLFVKMEGEIPVEVPNPHITLYYLGDLPAYNESTNVLSGLWGSGDPFDIHLVNETGRECDLLDNFTFVLVPEPATLIILALGSVLIRREK